MTATIEAQYRDGKLILPSPLPLPENAVVRLTIETMDDNSDAARKAWLQASEESLRRIWDNPGDDIFNEPLA